MRPVALLAVLLLVAPAAADWPQFHNDERNRGLGPGNYAAYDAVWWTEDLGIGRIEASPVVSDGILIIAGTSGKIVAMDASTGKVRWNQTMTQGILATPAIDNSRVYVVDQAGVLRSFDLHTGALYATASVGPTFGGLTVHEGSVYVGNEAGTMFRFESERLGKEVWKFDTGTVYRSRSVTGDPPVAKCSDKLTAGAIRGTPAVYRGTVFFGSNNNYVYAVSELGTGEVQWIHQTGDIVLSSPVIDQDRNRVLVGSYDRKLVSLPVSRSSGATDCGSTTGVYAPIQSASWTYSVPSDVGNSAVRATPAITGDRIILGALNGRVYAIDADNGRQLWDHSTGAALSGSPAVANNIVVAPNDSGRILWLHLENGTEIKRFEAESPLKASPALVQDRTYIATFDGRVSLLGAGFPARPDLEVDLPQHDGSMISVTIRNTGEGASDPTSLRLHLDNEFLADLNVTALGPGATRTLDHPLDLGPPFRIKATIDPMNAVAETNEENNVAEMVFVVREPDPTTPPDGDGPSTTTTGPPQGIPGPALPLVLALLALILLVRRRG